ncbi:MAG TPA: hypothetical protein VFJ62_20360, partial [Usitatibacter sp.]|nr:hypothetical protein [Usitatibacter sp.]
MNSLGKRGVAALIAQSYYHSTTKYFSGICARPNIALMYRYDAYDHAIVQERVAQFRDQTRRY